MFLESKVTEIAIGQIRGFVKPSKAERLAAYELFVELSARVTTVSIADERGFLRGTFDDLAAVGDITVEILRKHGCDAAKGRNDGNIALAVVALRVLNEIIAPRLIEWEPKLRDYEGRRTLQEPIVQPYAWERQWPPLPTAISDLAEMRREIRAYMDTLAAIAGTPSLTDLVVPLPPSAPINTVTLRPHVEARATDRPRKKMVRWFDPVEALGTMRANRGQHPHAPGGRPALGERSTPPMMMLAGNDGNTWIDYVSDLGDGFDATAAVAFQLTRASITLPIDRSGELPEPPSKLPRGQLLVMGGDEVYPHATADGYQQQLVLPYRMTADARTGGEPPTPERNEVLAIPGNHDWYGGHRHFEDVFVHADTFADHYRARQTERWWALALPEGWWMWGLDTALDNTVDDAQLAYFQHAAEQLREGDQVIVCSPVPLWQLRQKREKEYFALRATLNQLILQRGARIPLFLSGDSHFFAHYRRVDGAADEHHVTAGGGGAFMQPTHNLPEQVPYERGAPDFKLDARWPRPVESRSLATDLGNVRDPQFRWLFAIIAGVHAAFAGLVTIRTGALQHVDSPLDGPDTAARWVVAAWPGWPILALLLIAMTVATAPNSRESQLVKGSKRYGLMHGVMQAALFVAVAAFGRWVGPDAWWWRFIVVPLIGGVASTVLFVMAVRWINRSIKANDTLAFSSAHLTRYKHFVRMCIRPGGTLHLYVIGIDPVGEGWYDALTTPGALVPPYDTAGVPKLHYVWGRTFSNGSEEQVLERTRALGKDHPDTLHALAMHGRRLLERGEYEGAKAELLAAAERAEYVHGFDHPTTLAYREWLTDAVYFADGALVALPWEEWTAFTRVARDARGAGTQPLAEESREHLRTQLGTYLRYSDGTATSASLFGWWRLADAYTAAGRPDDALEVYDETLAAAVAGGYVDSTVARLQLMVAQTALLTSEPWRGSEAATKAAAAFERLSGPEAEDTLMAKVACAQLTPREEGRADVVGQRPTARADSVIAGLKDLIPNELGKLAADHPANLQARYALAQAYLATGRFEHAAPLMKVNIDVVGHPGQHNLSALLDYHHLLADVLHGQDLHEEAIEARQGAVDLCLAHRTPSHIGTLLSRLRLAESKFLAGHGPLAIAEMEALRAEACDLLTANPTFVDCVDAALEKARAVLTHPATADTAHVMRLAGNLWDHGAPREAADLLRGLIEADRIEADDVSLAFAQALDAAGETQWAARIVEARLDGYVATYGAESDETGWATTILAKQYMATGRVGEAVPLLRQVLPIAHSVGGPDDVEVMEELLADAVAQTGGLDEALQMRQAIVERRRSLYGEHSSEHLQARRAACELLSLADPAAAVVERSSILLQTADAVGFVNDWTWNDRDALAVALERADRSDEALHEREELLRLAMQHLGATDSVTSRARGQVARLSLLLHDPARTIALCQYQLTLDLETAAPDPAVTAQVNLLLAQALAATGRTGEARHAAELAAAHAARALPRNDDLRVRIDGVIASLAASVAPDR